MLSPLQETVIQLIRDRPSLVPELLAGALDVDVPSHQQVRLEPAECTVLAPTEFRADAVVVLRAAGRPVLVVVVEVQLHRDPGKRRSWPVYVATLHARWGCPTALLVICGDVSVARWCAQPIGIGPGWRGVPLVLGPDRMPVLTEVERASRTPELAVLSAMAHGADPNRTGVLDALVDALATIETERAVLYSQLVLAALPEAARNHMEALMSTETYEYQSDFTRRLEARGEARGKAAGEAEAVLTVLETRGVEVPQDISTRITECADPGQLTVWLRRAVTAVSAQDLFD